MGRIHAIVIDCRHPASLARFWAEVLDGYEIAPYDADELARLHALGVAGPDDDPTVLVEGPTGEPPLWFQLVPETKTVKNRVHLDVTADGDVHEVVERLRALGANVSADQLNADVVNMTDPEGNEFCVVR